MAKAPQKEKKPQESPFVFTVSNNSISDDYEVGYIYDRTGKKLKEPIKIGSLRSYSSSDGKFAIARIGEDRWTENWATPRFGANFADKESAAWALMVIYNSVQANPLPSEVRSFLQRRGENLRKEKQEVLSQVYAIQREQSELQHMANKHGLEFDFGVDMKKEVLDLKNFMERNNDALYENLGKDFARSLRAYVKSVVKLVDAEAAEDL